MKLQELINIVRPENVLYQHLQPAVCAAKTNFKTGVTKVTFATKEVDTGDLSGGRLPKKVGVVVWFPFDKLPKGIQESFRKVVDGPPLRRQSRQPAASRTGRKGAT